MSYTSFVFQIEYGLTRQSFRMRTNQPVTHTHTHTHTHTDSHFIMSCSSVPLLLWRFVFHISSSVQDLPHYSFRHMLSAVQLLFSSLMKRTLWDCCFSPSRINILNLTDDSLFNYSGFCPDRTLLIRSIWRKNISKCF